MPRRLGQIARMTAPPRSGARLRQRLLAWPKAIRIGVGLLLVLVGAFSILPVIGIWMVPAGLLVLSIDLPRIRLWRRQLEVWWGRRRRRRAAARTAAS